VDRLDRRRERGGAPVGQVVARHGGDDGEAEPHPLDRLGDPLGLGGVERLGVAGVDEAEPAGPGAALAVDHERGRAIGPALEDVGAAGLFADGDQAQVAHGVLQAQVARRRAEPRLQPVGLAGGDLQSVGHSRLRQAPPQPDRHPPAGVAAGVAGAFWRQ
jgi:hypothetical protein